jgi:hypothetical protein
MAQYKRKDAESAFELLCNALGVPKSRWDEEKKRFSPGLDLSYAPEYGGLVVREYDDHGVIGKPFGETRQQITPFCTMVNFALLVLDKGKRIAYDSGYKAGMDEVIRAPEAYIENNAPGFDAVMHTVRSIYTDGDSDSKR